MLSESHHGLDVGQVTFPPHYHKKQGLSSKDTVNAVIGCFKGELPKIMAEIYLCEDIDNEYYNLLNKVVYLGVHGGVFKQPSSNFVKQVVQGSICLEVVVLESYFDGEEEPTSMNGFVTFLLTQVRFLSNFRLYSRYCNTQTSLVILYCKRT